MNQYSLVEVSDEQEARRRFPNKDSRVCVTSTYLVEGGWQGNEALARASLLEDLNEAIRKSFASPVTVNPPNVIPYWFAREELELRRRDTLLCLRSWR